MQQRVKLIKDFQSVTDRGLELSELRKKAKEGSQLEVVQVKVQKNEIDLAFEEKFGLGFWPALIVGLALASFSIGTWLLFAPQ